MENDAALVNRDFVGGKIMWLPEKEMIDPSDMPELDDRLFDHPVLIISEHSKERTGIVHVLIITTFDGKGLYKKFGQSLQSRFYLALPPAPAHPCVNCREPLTFVEEDGYRNALGRSWINTRKSHSVSYRCLKNWKNWYRTPTLTKESLEAVINYRTNRVPEFERWEKENRRVEEESKKETKKKLSQPWRRSQPPGTETHGSIVRSASRAVTATADAPRMSVSLSAEMFRDNWSRTRKMEQDRKKDKCRCPLGYSCYLCCDDWRGGRRASNDPPKSKSISDMIPGSYIHKVEEEGTETPGDDVQATNSETWLLMDLSTTLGQKPLVSAPPEVFAMARFDVLARHVGMCDTLASIDVPKVLDRDLHRRTQH